MNTNPHMILVLPHGTSGGQKYDLRNSDQANAKLLALRESGIPKKRLVCYQLVEVSSPNTREIA